MADLLAMPAAAGCPRQDHARYLGDCVIRALLAGAPSGRTGDYVIKAGTGTFTVQAGEATFTPLRMRGAGDLVERAAKPIARALGLSCLDEAGNLRPSSPCGRRRDLLNEKLPFKRPAPPV